MICNTSAKRREDGVLIRMEVFTRLIKWFGPALPGDQGFIKKVIDRSS